MKRQYHLSDKDIVRLSIQETVKRLKPYPEQLALFLEDCLVGKHTSWKEYSRAKSCILLGELKGRAFPLRGGGTVGNAYEALRCYHAQAHRPQRLRHLPLEKCKTVMEKVRLIMKADIPKAIKSDLLSVL